MITPPRAATERATPGLRLRPPQESDLNFIQSMFSTPAVGTRLLTEWLAHWREFGFGYWIAEDRDGELVGCGGIKTASIGDREVLNLFYQVHPQFRRRGYARELAREATALAAEWVPAVDLTAGIAGDNTASLHLAAAAGLVQTSRLRRDDGDEVLLWEAPRFEAPTTASGLREELLELWMRVNAAGGAVGFMGPAPVDAVLAKLDPHLRSVNAGSSLIGVIRDPADHTLLGYGFVEPGTAQMAHVAWIKRLMTDPSRSGRNLGRILMGGLHALARDHGIEITRLTYRDGTGLGRFYARCGYVEIGRLPGGLRFGDDARDEVELATRLDGRPLRSAP